MTPAGSCSLVLAFGTTLALVVGGPAQTGVVRALEGAVGLPPAGARGDKPLALAQRFVAADQAELLLLLDELGRDERDPHQAARAIAELLAAGQTDAVTDHALESLGRLGAREARDSLVVYLRHRRPETRSRAYAALALLHDPGDAATLAQGLRDAAPEVRATAARALGDLKVADSAPLLLRALGRGVSEAAAALGKLGDAASVDEFGKYLGKQPLTVMLAGYANYLARADLPEPAKLKIVAALEEVSGPVVKQFLSDQVAKPPTSRSQKLQRALSATLARIKVEAVPGARSEQSP